MTAWAIQTNFIDQVQTDIVARAVLASGGSVYGAKVIPFCDDIEFVGGSPVGGSVVPYGSTKLTKLAIKQGWTGVFFNDNFDVVAWNSNRTDMLNQDAAIMRVDQTAEFLKDRTDDEPMFIRPCLDLKQFNGTLTRVGEIKNWMNSVDSGNFSFGPETVVAISEPKTIQSEWRWFIVDNQIVDGSLYRIRGQKLTMHETDQSVIDEAQKMADKWLPASVCVMDTALTPEGLKCVEFNCFNSSGFYKHDINKIVSTINKHLEKV